MTAPRIVLAPDKFKGSLSAAQVVAALADGIGEVLGDAVLVAAPVADGGDGTVAAAVAAGHTERQVTVDGPTGEPVVARYAMRGTQAVVELAGACGIDLLPDARLEPLTASTHGLGQVIAAAVDAGAREVVVGLGGSASTDGGAGMLQALGARVRTVTGEEVGRGGGALAGVADLDLAPLAARVDGVRFVVAVDVDNPLLGDRGAAAVFGPQKGADPDTVRRLDAALAVWADVVREAVGRDVAGQPGAGAAGGTGFAALAALDAELRPGIALVLELMRFDDLVAGADLVVTGEGSLDAQSLAGKAPVGVARAAHRQGVPVVAVAGRSLLGAADLAAAHLDRVYALTDLEPDVDRCIADAADLLRRTGRHLARAWVTGSADPDPTDRTA